MGTTTTGPAARDLHDLLSRWTAAGLIDAAQASRIEAAEAAGAAGPGHRPLPLVVEALGYLGAVVALAAGFEAVHQFQPHVSTGGELAFFGLAAATLTMAGAAVRARAAGEPALARLRSVLWLLATASAAGFGYVLADHVLRMSDTSVSLVTAATWAACAIPLWWRVRSALSQLSMFAGAVAVVETGLATITYSPRDWQLGACLWVLSAAWGAAAWRGYLVPRTPALAAAGSGALAGAIIAMDSAGGPVFALATVAGLVAVGVVSRRVVMLGLGAAGMIYVVPATAARYLPGSVAAPLAVALAGLLLLGVALWLARTRPSRPGAPRPQ